VYQPLASAVVGTVNRIRTYFTRPAAGATLGGADHLGERSLTHLGIL
jgi:hypothetical protein